MSPPSMPYFHPVELVAPAARLADRVARADLEDETRRDVVFGECWWRRDETVRAFSQGCFRTGNTGVFENGVDRILRRNSVEIGKSGGYKDPALEIEQTLLSHPLITECAFVGVPIPDSGERVCAAICLRHGEGLRLEVLRSEGKERLVHKVPGNIRPVNTLPRKAMGKVIKKEVARRFAASSVAVAQ